MDIMLPIIVNGKKMVCDEKDKCYEVTYNTDSCVYFPKLTNDMITQIKAADKYQLSRTRLQDIIEFLVKVGKFWSYENHNHPMYQEAIKYLANINGYSTKMALRQLSLTNASFIMPYGLYDLVESELGNRYYSDEWVQHNDALVHAQPFGNGLHILVGNVPVSSVWSIARNVLCKNTTIAKLSRRDPIIALYFVLSMIEIDPENPITKSINIVYWPSSEEDITDQLIDVSDLVCAWGGGDAIKSLKSKMTVGKEFVEFGPKSSYSIVGRESLKDPKVALNLAHDISIYDQEACFSPQVVFVEGEGIHVFAANLGKSLELYSGILPKGAKSLDSQANLRRSKIEAQYLGNTVLAGENNNWTVIVLNDIAEINDHPLGRLIYLVPVGSIKDVSKYISISTQTITISPWERNVEIRDEFTLRGVSRITEIGLVESNRLGSTHDGMFPMNRMVRWTCVERGLDHNGKYIDEGPLDTTKWLMMSDQLLENIDHLGNVMK